MLKFYIFYSKIENIPHITRSIFNGIISLQFKKFIKRLNRRKKTYFKNIFFISGGDFFGCMYFITAANDKRLFQYKNAEYIGNIDSIVSREPNNLHQTKNTELPAFATLFCHERIDYCFEKI